VLGDGVIPPWPATATPLRKRSPAGDVVAAYLREQTAAVLAWDPRVRLDEGDSVHKMRVATRRMRSALRTFRPLLDEAAVADVGTELRWLAAELGTVRDGEVLHARLRAAVDALPPSSSWARSPAGSRPTSWHRRSRPERRSSAR
jgi:CHAD domain-containing protein